MATTFLEPGSDADFAVATTNGFWGSLVATPTSNTDFVNTYHTHSIAYIAGATYAAITPAGACADAGTRASVWVYIVAYPAATQSFLRFYESTGATGLFAIRLTTTGGLQLANGTPTTLGSGGTLSLGQWYRVSVAYTIASTTVNRFEVFLNGVRVISVTDGTLLATGTSLLRIVNTGGSTFDFRSSDHYIDNSSALTDPGNIYVVAKRPFANGTANNFNTQIGAGGSGYGSGHAPQVNERPLSVTNGWSVVAVAATTEEYNIEGRNSGDVDLTMTNIVDYMGWVSTKALTGETVDIIINGVNFSQAITTTNTLYKKIAGATVYPAGTGADIGMTTDATATTVSLYECGIVFAFIPPTSNKLPLLGTG